MHTNENNNNKYRGSQLVIALVGVFLFLYSCASIGRPDGGPIDETPPKLLKSTPDDKSTNIDKKRIVLYFDEFIRLENANEKVVVSPPQIQQPLIRPSGKRVIVTLEDTLKENTTYTIDFGDAIVDNNEGNPLGDFTFTFSTGDVIDTMAISGTVLSAKDLEPIKNMLVGLHTNLNDTAFTTTPFIRVARTDSKGEFSIYGVSPGEYKIYGLVDVDQNYIFSQPNEWIAFDDSIYVPRYEQRMRQDTIWKDSLTVDTIHEKEYTHYLPDNIILRAFQEEHYSQYLIKHERTQPNKLSLYFSELADTLPTIKGLNFDSESLLVDSRLPSDTIIHYWVKDSVNLLKDTLLLQVDYLYTDTLNELVNKIDTLRFTYKHPKKSKDKDKEKDENKEKEKTPFLKPQLNTSGTMNIYDYISLQFDEPIAEIDTNKIHLEHKIDTLWTKIQDYEFLMDYDDIKKYNLFYKWVPGESYKLTIDSTAIKGLYGLHTNTIEEEFTIKQLEDYGTVLFNVTGVNENAYIELLDTSDKVVVTEKVVDGQANFYFLDPGKYSARMIIDSNNNGIWDTGNYEKKLQPEQVYYYPQFIEFKANWSANQDWDIFDTPLPKQKMDDLKKQKPEEEKKKRRRTNDKRR